MSRILTEANTCRINVVEHILTIFHLIILHPRLNGLGRLKGTDQGHHSSPPRNIGDPSDNVVHDFFGFVVCYN